MTANALMDACNRAEMSAMSWQRRAERAEGWLGELADLLGMEDAEPSALMWRVRDLVEQGGTR